MKPNSMRGYTLESTPEVHAAMWAARAAGNEQLADFIIKSAYQVNAPENKIGKAVDLPRRQTKQLVRVMGSVIEGEVTVHPSDLTIIEAMMGQHEGLDPAERIPGTERELAVSS